jgi:hypothetical protein
MYLSGGDAREENDKESEDFEHVVPQNSATNAARGK